jgi:hypothetical protein
MGRAMYRIQADRRVIVNRFASSLAALDGRRAWPLSRALAEVRALVCETPFARGATLAYNATASSNAGDVREGVGSCSRRVSTVFFSDGVSQKGLPLCYPFDLKLPS